MQHLQSPLSVGLSVDPVCLSCVKPCFSCQHPSVRHRCEHPGGVLPLAVIYGTEALNRPLRLSGFHQYSIHPIRVGLGPSAGRGSRLRGPMVSVHGVCSLIRVDKTRKQPAPSSHPEEPACYFPRSPMFIPSRRFLVAPSGVQLPLSIHDPPSGIALGLDVPAINTRTFSPPSQE